MYFGIFPADARVSVLGSSHILTLVTIKFDSLYYIKRTRTNEDNKIKKIVALYKFNVL